VDSLDLLRTFSEIGSSGSFSRTAKHLSLSRATVAPHGIDLTQLPMLINVFLDHCPQVSISLIWLSAVYLQRRHSTAVQRAFLDFLQHRLQPAGPLLREALPRV